MKDAQLASACVVLSLLGIIALVFFAKTLEPQRIALAQLNGDYVGKLVEVSGSIASVSTKESVTIVKICSSQCVDVVFFKSLREKLSFITLSKNQWLTVRGVVSEFKESLEITPLDENSVDVA